MTRNEVLRTPEDRLDQMEAQLAKNERPRIEALRDILIQQRNALLTRIQDLRRSQVEEKTTEPSDDLDIARSQAEAETHASLIEHSQDLLKAIDSAATRLDKGAYGKCEECGTDIPLNRLNALPFAVYCIDCQREMEAGRARGTIGDPVMRRWESPEEMNGSLERRDSATDSEDELVRSRSAFRPENGSRKSGGRGHARRHHDARHSG